jgi:hypothetical protein
MEKLGWLDESIGKLGEELNRLKTHHVLLSEKVVLTERALEALLALRDGKAPTAEVSESIQGESAQGERPSPTQIGAARRVLALGSNRPLHAMEIWRWVSRQGVTSKAKEPVWALATNLELSKDFEKVGRSVFRLTQEAYTKELEALAREGRPVTYRLPDINNVSEKEG